MTKQLRAMHSEIFAATLITNRLQKSLHSPILLHFPALTAYMQASLVR